MRIGKCVDGRESEEWEAKVDSGKIGKCGLKGLLRDGNTSTISDDDDIQGAEGEDSVQNQRGWFHEIGNQRG